MSGDNNISSNRGSYKKWLLSENVPIPDSTIRSRLKRARQDVPQAEQDKEQAAENENFVLRMTDFSKDVSTADYCYNSNSDEDESSTDEREYGNEFLPMTKDCQQTPNYHLCQNHYMNENLEAVSNEECNNETSSDENEVHLVEEIDKECDSCIDYDGYEDIRQDEPDDNSELDITEDNYEARTPLQGINLTQEESELLILHFAIRHHLSDVAIEDLIDLINCHLLRPIYRTKYSFLKKYDNRASIQKSFYCRFCENFLHKPHNRENASFMICSSCNRQFSIRDLNKNLHYFLRFSLKDQLCEFINSDKFRLFRQNDNSCSDVTSGKFYRSLVECNIISERDITLQFNTDGIKLFKSSPISLWPLQVCINELSYKRRRENMILCGLWYGSKKPNIDLFLNLFVEELQSLHESGITLEVANGQKITIKIHAIACPVDSVARPMLQNIKQYNGEFGCSFCLNPGHVVPIGNGLTRVYPGIDNILRTLQQHEKACEKALQSREGAYEGVKGPSILMFIPTFNIISSFTPDYMHSVLLGVVKLFTDAWFNSANNGKIWYLGTKIVFFDERLMSLRPPCEITRTPRSINDRNLWKATEWRNFLLYYSMICLQDLMPARYIKHWFLLVFSMHKLLQNKINDQDILTAENCLIKFVFGIRSLYDVQYYKFNVHLLLHIPNSVKLFGALWATSTFPYEHYNGVLSKMFRNSQAVPEQICKSYFRLRYVEKQACNIFFRQNCPANAKALYEKIMYGNFRTRNCNVYGAFLRLLGPPIQIELSLVTKNCIEHLLNENIKNNATTYHRFIYKNVLWHAEKYDKLQKRHNSTVKLQNESFITVTGIYGVNIMSNNQLHYVIVGKVLETTNIKLCSSDVIFDRITSKNLFVIAFETDQLVAILPQMLRAKCIKMPYDNENKLWCIVRLANDFERD